MEHMKRALRKESFLLEFVAWESVIFAPLIVIAIIGS